MPTQKITREQADKLLLLPFGKKHAVRLLIESLLPGELLEISRADFNWKGKTPNFFCKQIEQHSKAKFKIDKIRGKTGWVVERLQ